MADQKSDDGRIIFAFAHDLRGFLRTVLTRVQLVQADAALLPEQDRVFLQEAANAALDLNRLLSVMVSWFDVAPSTETTGLALMLRGLLIEMKAAITTAKASVSIENELDVPVAKALQSVLKELLTNSLRFRRNESPAEIRIHTSKPNPKTLEITVSDNGLGVDPDWLEKIFLPFQRMHSRSEFPGFGLGLALSQRVISANGGTVAARQSPSGGLTVTVALPI